MSRTNNEMAYIAQVTFLKSIPSADRIVAAIINGGFPVIVKKDEYNIGDLVILCEIDSWVPNSLVPFLTKEGKEPKEYNGVKGERLRTVKMKGQKSQGLVLPLSILPELPDDVEQWKDGDRVGSLLGIQKWEPSDTFNAGNAKGSFPNWLEKTDQERCERLAKELFGIDSEYKNVVFEVDLKLDGSSTQVGVFDGQFVVCSRTIQLKTDDETSTFVKTAKKVFGDNGERIPEKYHNLSFQSELCGPRVCLNREGLTEHELYVFDIYDTSKRSLIGCDLRHDICKELGLKEAPVLARGTLRDLGINSLDDMIQFAEGPSINNPVREGVVFKTLDGSFHYKSISDTYLLEKGN